MQTAKEEIKKLLQDRMRKQCGIPDWRDASAYPKALTGDGWRWEFLRRREDYRKDWFASAPHPRVYKVGAFAKYGLRVPIDPAQPCVHGFCPGTFVSTFEPGAMEPGAMEPGRLYKRITPTLSIPVDCCAIAFNYTLPIKPQMERAEYQLNFMQKHLQIRNSRRKRPEKWGDYLRVIDARAEGVSFAAIGEVLRPDLVYNEAAARAEELYKAAITLMTNFPA